MDAITVYLPDAGESANAAVLAELFIEQQGRLARVSRAYYAMRRQLGEAIRTNGPLVLQDGRRLDAQNSQWDYPEAIASEYPALADPTVSVKLDGVQQAERAVDLLREQFVGAEVSVTWKVDGRRARRAIDQGGPVAHRLLELRMPRKAEIVVVP